MQVINTHQRLFNCPAIRVGTLIDLLASPQNCLWPSYLWPNMKFDKEISIGARGGHGPIRYFIENYSRGKFISFRFTGPSGFRGMHKFEVIQISSDSCKLQHLLELNPKGLARLTWPLIYRPLHDALIEDALATGQLNLQINPEIKQWSLWVKCLRWILSAGKAKPQTIQSMPRCPQV
jgi:hypothetical protein